LLNTLSDRLTVVLRKVKGWGSLNEKNIKEGLREIKLALLEADVNYKVVKEFVDGTTKEALGEKVFKSITPAQQFTKIVYNQLVKILGGDAHDVSINKGGISIIMLVGLQGSGKTTTAVKLARLLDRNYNKKPLLVAADVYRPAAIKQLELLSEKNGYSLFTEKGKTPLKICQGAVKYAKNNSYGAVIIDTAGRLELNNQMMEELVEIKNKIKPHEVLLVADAATGQVAVNVAKGFNEKLDISGIILSRMDSDARGGAALSMSYVTGKNIKYIGTGEKIQDLETFYPSRVAGRILEMGDIISLVEKAQDSFDIEQAKKLEKKIKKDTFDLNDFLEQLRQIKKMGPLENILEMIPGIPKKANIKIDGKELKVPEAIINSMTKYERSHIKIINGSRKKRIAVGSGTSVFEVNRLLNNFQQMRKMIKKFRKGGKDKGSPLSSLMKLGF